MLVSEYNMPNDFKCIWQKERKVLQKSDRVTGEKAVEKLFVYNQKLDVLIVTNVNIEVRYVYAIYQKMMKCVHLYKSTVNFGFLACHETK